MISDQMIADGWQVHDGGPCPVADDAYVAVMFKHMLPTSFAPADCFDWNDVRAYKPEGTSHDQ